MTHAEMCKLAVKWLQLPASRGGHGCKVAIDERRSGWSGEVPDAIGFRFLGSANDPRDGTVLVECKVSRSDFLADFAKPHRQSGGLGNWRYYMAPQGLISPEELPAKWGLVEVNARGHLKLIRGAFVCSNYTLQTERLAAMRHEGNPLRELYMLTQLFHLFDRLSDRDKMITVAKERTRLGFRVNELSMQLREQEREVGALETEVRHLKEQLAQYRELHGELPPIKTLPMQRWDGSQPCSAGV